MHRMTPRSSAFRAFSGGGARATVDKMDTVHLFQEMAGNFMSNEMRKGVEHFEAYGFTSAILPKNAQGAAEALMSFVGGSRSHPIAGVIGDRRFRPRGLKPGENAQYDDIGQMTLLRRGFAALLSHDGEDGDGNKKERFASLRHVTKSKQSKPTTSTNATTVQQSNQQQQDFKHEGDSVNLEVRATAKRIEFRAGDAVVGYYDKGASTWVFIGKVKLGSEDAADMVEGGDKLAENVFVKGTKTAPADTGDSQP